MIQYALKCENGHGFDSWFQTSSAFEKLRKAEMVTCPICQSTSIKKSIMAPRVQTARSAATKPIDSNTTNKNTDLSAPQSDAEKELAKLKTDIENTAEYVGQEFAARARDMYIGETPQKPIFGETSLEDAKKLLDDGVPVAPLPFVPTRKTN